MVPPFARRAQDSDASGAGPALPHHGRNVQPPLRLQGVERIFNLFKKSAENQRRVVERHSSARAPCKPLLSEDAEQKIISFAKTPKSFQGESHESNIAGEPCVHKERASV